MTCTTQTNEPRKFSMRMRSDKDT